MIITIMPQLAARIFRLSVLAATCLPLVGFIASYRYWPEEWGFWGLRDSLSSFWLDPSSVHLRFLSVNAEPSLAAWFSSALLLLCSVLAFGTPATGSEHAVRYAGRWKVLALLLLLMSLDEAVALHEKTMGPLRAALSAGGPFYYTWVIPGAIFVLAFALAYLGFLLDLSPKIRRLFAVAGTLYLCGVLLIEMVGGAIADANMDADIAYLTIVSVEEYLEMLGLATLLYALMLQSGSRSTGRRARRLRARAVP